jgi:hypothetical protein
VSLVRVQQSTQVTLSHTFEVDEVPTDAGGTVTYVFKRLDGTALTPPAAGNAGHPGGAGIYAAVLPGANTALLDTYTLDWSGTVAGAAVTVRDYVEVAGGFLFGLGEARRKSPALDPVKYLTADLAAVRVEVEVECERMCGVAWVPRFKRVAVDVNGCTTQLLTPHTQLRALRAVTVNGTAWTVGQVAAVLVSESGVLTLPAGNVWPVGAAGRSRVVLEYEHGFDYPPEEIRTAAMVRLRSKLGQFDTSVPYRAISFTSGEGGTYRLSTPSRDRTGIPSVDAVYEGNHVEVGGFA